MAYSIKYNYIDKKELLNTEIDLHKQHESIKTIDKSDISEIKLNINRAINELREAKTLFRISEDLQLKKDLELEDTETFYSGTITHAYYAIFFSAKSLLLKEKIKTKSPNIHKATLDAFAYYLINTGKLDLELLNIYKSNILKADSLLGLFISEKEKRGEFTYQKLPDANKIPAKESIESADKFLKNIKLILDRETNLKKNKEI